MTQENASSDLVAARRFHIATRMISTFQNSAIAPTNHAVLTSLPETIAPLVQHPQIQSILIKQAAKKQHQKNKHEASSKQTGDWANFGTKIDERPVYRLASVLYFSAPSEREAFANQVFACWYHKEILACISKQEKQLILGALGQSAYDTAVREAAFMYLPIASIEKVNSFEDLKNKGSKRAITETGLWLLACLVDQFLECFPPDLPKTAVNPSNISPFNTFHAKLSSLQTDFIFKLALRKQSSWSQFLV